MIIPIKGAIIRNSHQWIYDLFEMDATSPGRVLKAINDSQNEKLEFHINSSGGDISAGSEIYTAIKAHQGEKVANIVGQAYSAASVIAMACESYMSPTAMMMIHQVSCSAGGNSSDFTKMAQVLNVADRSIANAYIVKTGMSMEDALKMMQDETWLSADQAKEKGLIDGIMFQDTSSTQILTNSFSGLIPQEIINKMISDRMKNASLKDLQNKYKYLELKARNI